MRGLDNCAIRRFIICKSVDGHGDGNGNGPGGRSKRFGGVAGGIVGGGKGSNEEAAAAERAADGTRMGFDSVAEGDGERPFDEGQ